MLSMRTRLDNRLNAAWRARAGMDDHAGFPPFCDAVHGGGKPNGHAQDGGKEHGHPHVRGMETKYSKGKEIAYQELETIHP